MKRPPKLTEVARDCRAVVERARIALGHDLCGHSMLDLVADQFPDLPLETLRDALIVAGLDKGNANKE